MVLKGIAKYIELEMGFWGIVTEEADYFPLNMPEQLKANNTQIECTVEILEDVVTMHNWGQPCNILSFKTIQSDHK